MAIFVMNLELVLTEPSKLLDQQLKKNGHNRQKQLMKMTLIPVSFSWPEDNNRIRRNRSQKDSKKVFIMKRLTQLPSSVSSIKIFCYSRKLFWFCFSSSFRSLSLSLFVSVFLFHPWHFCLWVLISQEFGCLCQVLLTHHYPFIRYPQVSTKESYTRGSCYEGVKWKKMPVSWKSSLRSWEEKSYHYTLDYVCLCFWIFWTK